MTEGESLRFLFGWTVFATGCAIMTQIFGDGKRSEKEAFVCWIFLPMLIVLVAIVFHKRSRYFLKSYIDLLLNRKLIKPMQTLKIEIPIGYEIESFDKLSGQIKLREKPKNVTERIRTVDDVLQDNGLTQAQFEQNCKGLEPDEVAYRILKLLAKSLNEGWQPDWNNSNEYKYVPWFYMENGSSGFRFGDCDFWASGSCVGSRLCFKTRELCEYAGKQFADVYKQFMLI